MNKAKAKRWLNEYLDGEIGLADKAEFERLMAQDPELRQEYEELRKIGLLMSSGPEVEVNPVSFRARLMERIEPQQRYDFTPQRAFAGSMLVALLVVGLSFGQFIYSRVMEPAGQSGSTSVAALTSESSLNMNCTASQFLNASLLRAENGVGSESGRLVELLERQTGLFEGAFCIESATGHNYIFPGGLPTEISIRVEPDTLRELQEISSKLSGSGDSASLRMHDGSELRPNDYTMLNPQGKISLRLIFNNQ